MISPANCKEIHFHLTQRTVTFFSGAGEVLPNPVDLRVMGVLEAADLEASGVSPAGVGLTLLERRPVALRELLALPERKVD